MKGCLGIMQGLNYLKSNHNLYSIFVLNSCSKNIEILEYKPKQQIPLQINKNV